MQLDDECFADIMEKLHNFTLLTRDGQTTMWIDRASGSQEAGVARRKYNMATSAGRASGGRSADDADHKPCTWRLRRPVATRSDMRPMHEPEGLKPRFRAIDSA